MFRGGFELEAAEAICGGDHLAPDALLDLVGALVDKSILIREPAGELARYRWLETIRDFGWTKLEEKGAAKALRRRHRDWYARFIEEADADWIGPRQVDWLTRIDRDLPNIQAALEFWFSEPGEAEVGLRITAALAHDYYFLRGGFSEGRYWLGQALARHLGSSSDRLRALYLDIVMALVQGDVAEAAGLVEQAALAADQLRDASARAYSTFSAGAHALWAGDPGGASASFLDSLAQFREEGNVRFQLEALIALGNSIWFEDERRARAYKEEVVLITGLQRELIYRSYAFRSLGIAAWRDGDPQRGASGVR